MTGGILVGYASREGTVALDGVGRNSPYAQALLEFMEEPGLEVSKLFRKVRDRVFEVTDGRQEPFTYGSLPADDIYLKTAVPLLELSPAAPSEPPVGAALLADFTAADATDTLAVWDAFLDKHGADQTNGLVRIAQRRRAEIAAALEDAARPVAPQPWLVPQSGRKAPPLALTARERMHIQKALLYMGYDTGGIDGQFGPQSRQAISAARRAVGLPPGTAVDLPFLAALPDPGLVDQLKSPKARGFDVGALHPHLEPRLRGALQQLDTFEIVFDYFEGRLYLAVAGQGFGSFDFKNAIAGRAGGHLVTLTSVEEDRFVQQLFGRDEKFVERSSDGTWRGPVIGLVQQPDGREPNGGWGWVTGEPLRYANWARGQPDHASWREDAASYFGRGASGGSVQFWGDTQGNWKSFIIEIE